MVLLDTNIFVIDRFFARDENYTANQAFLSRSRKMDCGFSIFSLFELCGIASFNLSPVELRRWSYDFRRIYGVKVLEPLGLSNASTAEWFAQFSRGMFSLFERKMSWGDAVLLQTAEDYDTEVILTWNKKHFEGRTAIRILTPAEYLSE
jgi:predicted nucleic acid-binding protein